MLFSHVRILGEAAFTRKPIDHQHGERGISRRMWRTCKGSIGKNKKNKKLKPRKKENYRQIFSIQGRIIHKLSTERRKTISHFQTISASLDIADSNDQTAKCQLALLWSLLPTADCQNYLSLSLSADEERMREEQLILIRNRVALSATSCMEDLCFVNNLHIVRFQNLGGSIIEEAGSCCYKQEWAQLRAKTKIIIKAIFLDDFIAVFISFFREVKSLKKISLNRHLKSGTLQKFITCL